MRSHDRARLGALPVGWRIYGWVRSTILTLASVLGVISILVFATALLFGLRPVVVISGSMEPTLPVGSVVLIRTVPVSEVAVGDIVTVERPRDLGLVTHRVVEIIDVDGQTGLELKGDANDDIDPQPYTVATAAKYVGHIPALGYVTLFFQSRQGLIAGVGIIAAMFAVFLLDPSRVARRDRRDEREERDERDEDHPGSGSRDDGSPDRSLTELFE